MHTTIPATGARISELNFVVRCCCADACRLSFAVAVILLATAASMNHGQRYGRGWMDGDCYVARNGVFGGAAALVVVTALITLGLTFATESAAAAGAMATTPTASSSSSSATRTTRTHLDAASADAEQPGGRSKQ